MRGRFAVELVEPIKNPCAACWGSGGEWPRRKDGERDRRYWWPVGPCPSCDGMGDADTKGRPS